MQTVLTADSLRQADHDAVDITRGARIPSLQEVREMAARQSSGLEAAKRLRTIARVASDLQGQIVAVVVLSLSIVGGCCFFAVVFPTLSDRPWVYTEMVLLYPVWAMLVPMTGGFILFAFNAVSELKQIQVSDVDWNPPKLSPITFHVQPRGAGGILSDRALGIRTETWGPDVEAHRHRDRDRDGDGDEDLDGDLIPLGLLDEESRGGSSADGADKDERSFQDGRLEDVHFDRFSSDK